MQCKYYKYYEYDQSLNWQILAKELGGEYIYQDDKAQVDAIQLVADISDNCLRSDYGRVYSFVLPK